MLKQSHVDLDGWRFWRLLTILEVNEVSAPWWAAGVHGDTEWVDGGKGLSLKVIVRPLSVYTGIFADLRHFLRNLSLCIAPCAPCSNHSMVGFVGLLLLSSVQLHAPWWIFTSNGSCRVHSRSLSCPELLWYTRDCSLQIHFLWIRVCWELFWGPFLKYLDLLTFPYQPGSLMDVCRGRNCQQMYMWVCENIFQSCFPNWTAPLWFDLLPICSRTKIINMPKLKTSVNPGMVLASLVES